MTTMTMSPRLTRYLLRIALALSCGSCSNTFAQLRLPSAPSLPTAQQLPLNMLEHTLTNADTTVSELDSRARKNLRTLQIRELLHAQRAQVEADPNGAPILRNEVVAISPSAAALERIRSAGFSVIATRQLADLDIELLTLATPAGISTTDALQQLRALDPTGQYDFNHLYLRSGDIDATNPSLTAVTATATTTTTMTNRNPVGLIDSGVERKHPVFAQSDVHTWGCNEHEIPSAHGTAVASLLIGADQQFRGAAPNAPLFAADIYCGEPTGGDVATIAAACAWLAQQRVPVINISLVGPPNLLLERVIRRLQERGHILVAAVGNDGPAAPPLYPAAYAGVIGVTAVDGRDRVLLEAGRGPHVTFAAPGADIFAATLSNTFTKVRGTSFAAPIVAGLLSRQMNEPNREKVATALSQLSVTAIDLGPNGRDDIYGEGVVGKEIRVTARNP